MASWWTLDKTQRQSATKYINGDSENRLALDNHFIIGDLLTLTC